MNPIYLDYNATTPVDKEVAATMLPYLTELFGNPSSSHSYGYIAKTAIEKAREQVAAMLNCFPDEVIFTSGGTESNNMAITGIALANINKGKHIIISAIEHPAVTEVAHSLELRGFEISKLSVDKSGRVEPSELETAMRPDTILVSVMHANNETGTIQPIHELADIARKHGVLFHTDAAQSVGKIKTDVRDLAVDLLSIAGHKFYAPKGVGALFIKRGVVLRKFMHGANHESDMRPGTENVTNIVALGKACQLVTENLNQYSIVMQQMRDQLIKGLSENFPDMHINGHPQFCLPNTLNVSFKNLGAPYIIRHLKGVAVSAGAACHSSATSGASDTLSAMNLPPEYSLGALRLTTGRYTTGEEINMAVALIAEAVKAAIENTPAIESLLPFGHRLNISHAEQINIELNSVGSNTPSNKTTDTYKRADSIPLTEFDSGMGCGCKIKPAALEYLLKKLPDQVHFPAEVLVAHDTSDDAAVWKINEETAIVQTVDFFTPMVNNPYHFGAIAAANALSDVYAMGAKPIFALNLVSFPVSHLSLDVLCEIMKGASDKVTEAGAVILGGHSIEDSSVKYGMVVTGTVSPKRILKNCGSQPGDMIILTKPIGTGIISKALSMGMVHEEEKLVQSVIRSMSTLNKVAAEVMEHYPVSACTDITGFGLAGHLHEMLKASSVDAEIWFNDIPLFEGTARLAASGAIPASTRSNEDFANEWLDADALKSFQKAIICDSQTSGGLLFTLPSIDTTPLLSEMKAKGVDARVVGQTRSQGAGIVRVSQNRLS